MGKKNLLFIFGGVGALLVVLLLFFTFSGGNAGKTTLSVWGPLEGSDSGWEKIIKRYAKENPDITLEYRRIPFDEYRPELTNAFATGEAPDIFYIHNTWLPIFEDKLAPMPRGVGWMNFTEYRNTFVDAVVDDFTLNSSRIYAMPLFLETLALFYNTDMFSDVGIVNPPKSWVDFGYTVRRLTVRDADNNLVQMGAALGTSENVNVGTDTLSLMMLQYFDDEAIIEPEGGKINIKASDGQGGGGISPALEAVTLYTSFANPASANYTWNREQWYSIDAFIAGKAAMMLNYPSHIATVKSRAPQLKFDIARAPQTQELLDQRRAIDYASYWGLGINSRNDPQKRTQAWSFVQWMGERAQQEDSYVRYTAEPLKLSPRRDLVAGLVDDPTYGVFARQALTARTWFQPDSTEIRIILDDLIEDVIAGVRTRDAIVDARKKISELLSAYTEKRERK